MPLSARNLVQTTVIALAILILCPALHANTILVVTSLGAPVYGYTHTDEDGTKTTYTLNNVGPYNAKFDGGPTVLVFCLDLHNATNINWPYDGTLSAPTAGQEEEAAFLASYALQPGNDRSYSAIQMAIWQVMDTLGGTKSDDAAQQFVEMAQNSVRENPGSFMTAARIFNPDIITSQRFVTATPEPGTVILLSTGMLLLALSRIRRRRP